MKNANAEPDALFERLLERARKRQVQEAVVLVLNDECRAEQLNTMLTKDQADCLMSYGKLRLANRALVADVTNR